MSFFLLQFYIFVGTLLQNHDSNYLNLMSWFPCPRGSSKSQQQQQQPTDAKYNIMIKIFDMVDWIFLLLLICIYLFENFEKRIKQYTNRQKSFKSNSSSKRAKLCLKMATCGPKIGFICMCLGTKKPAICSSQNWNSFVPLIMKQLVPQ